MERARPAPAPRPWPRADSSFADLGRQGQYGRIPEQEVPVDSLDKELDHLYALEPGAFVSERDRLARELREAGDRGQSEQVKRLRKPTVSAWAINRLARQERREIDLLLDAGHRLREAQQGVLAGEDRKALDEARRTEREALAHLREAARGILAEEDRVSETTLNRIAGTLQAAAVSSEGRELLARGRLTGDLEATGFELLAPLAGGTQKQRSRRIPRGKPDADRKGDEEARKRLDAARDRLRDAREGAKAAEKDVRTAERDADRAQRELARAEEAAAKARKRVESAEKELREAERKARRKAR
jgi:hypothetical protein